MVFLFVTLVFYSPFMNPVGHRSMGLPQARLLDDADVSAIKRLV